MVRSDPLHKGVGTLDDPLHHPVSTVTDKSAARVEVRGRVAVREPSDAADPVTQRGVKGKKMLRVAFTTSTCSERPLEKVKVRLSNGFIPGVVAVQDLSERKIKNVHAL